MLGGMGPPTKSVGENVSEAVGTTGNGEELFS